MDLWRLIEALVAAIVGILAMMYRRLEARVTDLEKESATKADIRTVTDTMETNRKETREDFSGVRTSLNQILHELTKHG